MALTNDILLDGVPFNVVPGKYLKASAKPISASRPTRKVARARFGPFVGGVGQAIAELATRGWDAEGVGPAFDGMGLEPFPNLTSFDDSAALTSAPSTTARVHGAIVASTARAYLGLGQKIYKTVQLTNGTWAAVTQAADLGGGFTVSGLANYGDDLLVLLSTGQDIRRFNTNTETLTTWRAGEKGVLGVGYAGQLVYAPKLASAQDELRISGTRWNGNAITHVRYLDGPILNMALYNGRVAIATVASLWFLGGQNYPGEPDDASVTADTSKAPEWTEDPEPVMTHGTFAAADDFVFLCSYRGRLTTWLQGRVAVFDETQEQGRWLRVGPEGSACYGGAICGDWLVVAIASRYGEAELWGFDGAGWWLFDRRASPAYIWPCAVGGAGNREAIVFRDGSETYDLARFKWRSSSVHTYATAGQWVSSLLDGDDPAAVKVWTEVGAAFVAPAQRGNSGSADQVTITLEYSTDGGANWTQAATLNSSAPATRAFTLVSSFNPPPESRYLQLRVLWSSISDWAPVLASVWADAEEETAYDLAELQQAEFDAAQAANAVARRRWELTVDAADRRVRRDGSAEPQTGRMQIRDLWRSWESGAAVAFKDIDDDAAVWTPDELTMLARQRASDLGSLAAGTAVASYTDVSNNGRHATNGTAAERPTFQPGVLGGLPVVRFDGVDDDLTIANLPMVQPWWFFFVLSTTSTAGRIFEGIGTVTLRVSGGSGQDVTMGAGANQNFAELDLSDDAFHMIFGQVNGASSYMAQDGTNTIARDIGAGGGTANLVLGSTGSAAFLQMDHAESVMGAGVLSAANLDRLFGYAAHRYGLAGLLPGGHPYKSAAPRVDPDYLVTIESIAERVAKPSDSGRWGQSQIELSLLESV